MKRILLCIVCLFALTFVSSRAAIIEVAPAGAWGVLGINGGGVVAGATGQTIVDDFTSYGSAEAHLIANWQELSGAGATHINTSTDVMYTDAAESFSIIYDGQATDTITQYGAVRFAGDVTFTGLYFRSDGNASNRAYALRVDGADDIQWRDCLGHSCQDVDQPTAGDGTCNPTVSVGTGTSIGFRVTGIGTNTVLEVWAWSGDPPAVTDGDVDTAWSSPDCTLTGNPDAAANDGTYVGLYNGASDAGSFSLFRAGDSTN